MKRIGSKPAENEPYPAEIQAILATPYGLKGFKRFCALVGLEVHPFQAYMLRLYFAGVVELVIVIPKKNGKTTLLAALALYHVLMTPDARCYIGAASREQAARLHEAATAMVLRAGLERRALPGDRREPTRYAGVFEVREGMHVIRFERGVMRVLPHEVRGGDGVMPTLALVDELHRHPTGQLYGVFRDGIDSQDGQMITISTAGADMDSPLGALLERARRLPMTRLGRRHTYRSETFAAVEWALHPEDNPHDIRKVKMANPAPWHTLAKLRARHDSPSMTPGQWLRYACGVWTAGEEPVITPAEWDALRVDEPWQVGTDEPVWLAPSVGHNAAVALAAARDDGRLVVHVEHLGPEDGKSILVRTEDLIVDLCERYRVTEAHVPLGGFRRSVELLEMRGVPVVQAPHSPQRLVEFTGTLNRLLRAGLLAHAGDRTTRTQVLNAQLKTTETGERYIMDDRSRAVIAIAAACHAASAPADDLKMILPSAGGVG